MERGLFETAESHEEGVEALRFALDYHSPEAAVELLDDLDGADAVQRAHLVLMAEADDNAFVAVHTALPAHAPVRRRLGNELSR